MKIVDRFGSRPGAELVRLPQGGERLLAVEHAAALLVNEQTAFRVVCTPELLPQLALGRLLTEGWIASADEVEQVAVCAEGLKVSVHLTHPLAAAPAAGQEVPSCCTDNLTVASPVVLRPLAPPDRQAVEQRPHKEELYQKVREHHGEEGGQVLQKGRVPAHELHAPRPPGQ